MRMMPAIRRVTIFGGDGFIGRYVVRRLAAQGATVIVYGRHAHDAGFLRPMGNPGQILLANGDVRDQHKVAGAVAGSDAVINLVGILRQSGRQDFLGLHRDAARMIAEAARDAGARHFVQVSAIGADPASPSLYARSRAAGERAVLEVFPRAAILRSSIVFGIEDQFFNRFAGMAQLSPIVPLVGAKTRFQPVYVDDVAAAIAAALDRPEACGWIYELGGPEIFTFRELIALLLREIGIRRWILDLPLPLARLMALAGAIVPGVPITLDQIRMLARDNVISLTASGLSALGVVATPLAAVLPRIAARFHPLQTPDGGR